MKSSKSSLFLMELIIVILFFSLASAVCIQLFVKAHTLDDDTVSVTHLGIAVQDAAECFYGVSGDLEAYRQIYGKDDLFQSVGCALPVLQSEGHVMLAYDQDMDVCDTSDLAHFRYILLFECFDSPVPGSMQKGLITVYDLKDTAMYVDDTFQLEKDSDRILNLYNAISELDPVDSLEVSLYHNNTL